MRRPSHVLDDVLRLRRSLSAFQLGKISFTAMRQLKLPKRSGTRVAGGMHGDVMASGSGYLTFQVDRHQCGGR